MDLASGDAAPKLPFGLSHAGTLESAVKKLSAAKGHPQFAIFGNSATTGLCLKNLSGIDFVATVEAGKDGKLRSFETTTRGVSRLVDFGLIALGDPVSKLPSDAEPVAGCDRNSKTCEFIDRGGVTYKSAGGVIVEKSIREIGRNPRAALPFTLKAATASIKRYKKLLPSKTATIWLSHSMARKWWRPRPSWVTAENPFFAGSSLSS